MKESKLFVAAKKLVDMRTAFYEKHPELISEPVQAEIKEDLEYLEAWEELEKAVNESEQNACN